MFNCFFHVPVLSRELVAGLGIKLGGHYLDATVGGGGHSQLLLDAAPGVQVTAIDRDLNAIEAARTRLAAYSDRVQFWSGNFAEYAPPSPAYFDGIVADLGVSSAQLDIPERGFSFRHCAPLDMRMDARQSLTAAEIVNFWDEKTLADLFYNYGEERLSRRIARQIVARRPWQTTTELAEAIAACVPAKYRHGRIHPATRVFQALRIAVNGELDALSALLDRAPDWLRPEACIGIISFHSLEDRAIKHHYRNDSRLQVVTKKPLVADAEERDRNPRSRSAKLRFARRINCSRRGKRC